MSCKFLVAPHAAIHGKDSTHPVSQRGFRDAKRRAANIAAKTGDATIFLSCPRGEVRVASCSDIHARHGGSLCRIEGETGGASTRVLAGTKKRRKKVRK